MSPISSPVNRAGTTCAGAQPFEMVSVHSVNWHLYASVTEPVATKMLETAAMQ